MNIVELRNVSKTYKMGDTEVKSLSNVNLEAEKGKFTIILGPSGCGKSTMLNIIGGMEKSDSGNILIDGMDISGYSAKKLTEYRRKDVGFVFQFYNLIPNLTAFENVNIACRLSKEAYDADKVLEDVGMSDRRNHFPAQMSGGEMQRISIARAICKNPKILLCDEPTGALDSGTGRKILELLQKMVKEQNKTVIMVTHNSLIAPCADRVLHMRDGSIQKVIDNENPVKVEDIEW